MTMTAKRFFICNRAANMVCDDPMLNLFPLLWHAQSKLFAAFGNRYRNCKRDSVTQYNSNGAWYVNNNGNTNNNNRTNSYFVAPVLDI